MAWILLSATTEEVQEGQACFQAGLRSHQPVVLEL